MRLSSVGDMTPAVPTLDDFELAGRTVLLRLDINSPVDRQTKVIEDNTRIRRLAEAAARHRGNRGP